MKTDKKQGQIKRTLQAFSSEPKTMLQVSIETNILRANVCRYVAMFRKTDRIKLVNKGYCPISRHRAGFYTTSTK